MYSSGNYSNKVVNTEFLKLTCIYNQQHIPEAIDFTSLLLGNEEWSGTYTNF